MSSRIFIKNLPPTLSEDDFRKHFAQVAPTTDVKLIPRRRIGFVGYGSGEEAAKAVKYFNKSFIRMSKISVELAKSPGEVQPRRKSGQPAPNVEKQSQRLRSTEAGDNATGRNSKLDEFLQAMTPPSKSKTWANGDSSGDVNPVSTARQRMSATDEAGNEDEYQTVSRKRKRPTHEDEEDEGYASSIKSPRIAPLMSGAIEAPVVESLGAAEQLVGNIAVETASEKINLPFSDEATETIEITAPVSDSDWLRSKTSRLLGLVDEDEFEMNKETQLANQELSKIERLDKDGKLKTSPTPSVPDFASQTDEEYPVKNAASSPRHLAGENEASNETPQVRSESTARLFLRNLPYNASEPDVSSYFSGFGSIEEVHISRDTRSGVSKGFAYVQFEEADQAARAMKELDGKPFQGRLLHVLPAAAKKERGLSEYEISKLPLKKQQQIRRKAEAARATFQWNSLYMNPDAVVSSVADRLGIAKSEVLDPTSTDAAVRQAHAETSVIQETKNYFSSQGVDLDSFKKREHSDKVILVKNFPYGATAEEIKKPFETFGTVTRLLMPPSATIAIVEMEQPTQARAAFGSLAYRKFKDSVLFLEKAPKGIFEGKATEYSADISTKDTKVLSSELLEEPDTTEASLTSTLFIRNLNFSTTSQDLHDLFKSLQGFLTARVKTKTNPKKPGEYLSMGFGFVEFKSKDHALSAAAALNGYRLAGHELVIKESHKALDAAEERRREDVAKKVAGRRTKIIIKNLPFEASKKDVRALFGSYGQLRSVRVPKKFDSSSRGFAFADFVTTREAENVMKALQGVHLLGRRLNLDFASEESIDPEEEIEKMQRKVGKQTDKVTIQRLTSGGRKKFSVQQNDEAQID